MGETTLARYCELFSFTLPVPDEFLIITLKLYYIFTSAFLFSLLFEFQPLLCLPSSPLLYFSFFPYLCFAFLLLTVSCPPCLSSCVTEYPSVMVTSAQRHHRGGVRSTEKWSVREDKSGWFEMTFNLYWLNSQEEWWRVTNWHFPA